ncbi:MAG: nuclear transport factor 2 family protein [Gemmatimonadetes bacterium]|nr:nuclear transport factor 2 family protein [Gemmatimonadota bacterium]
MYGRFTRAFVLCAISAGAVAACSSKSERAAVDSAKAAAPTTDTAAHAAAPAAAAPAASADEEIKAAENSWRIALVSGDTVTLGKMTATEFTMPKAGHPALTTSRKDLMTEIGSGMVQSDTSAVNDLAVKTSGDTAVATGQFYWKPSRMGKPAKVESESFADTWVRRGGNWVLVARKASGPAKK